MTRYYYCLENTDGYRAFHSLMTELSWDRVLDYLLDIANDRNLRLHGPCLTKEELGEEIMCKECDA